jgi:predicted nucleotidyltransferase
MAFGLSDNTCATIRAILAGYPAIAKAVIYGSRAKGNYTPGSDIDLTLMGDALDFKVLSAVASALDESDIPYTVDVSGFDRIENPALREHIERVGMVFYEREDRAT